MFAHEQKLPPATPSDHPVDVGLRHELAVCSELVKRGYHVLTPLGQNERYDLVLDVDGTFIRGQSKTGRIRNGAVKFATRSVRTNSTGTFVRDYDGEADFFFVYCAELGSIYAVPVLLAPRREMSLRIDPCKNKQIVGVHFAADYELPT